MNNKLLVFSSSALATGLLLGLGTSGAAHADTTMNQDNMNGNMNQKAMMMNQGNMDNMNGNMNQKDMMMNQGNMGDMNGNMNQKGMMNQGNMWNMNNNMNGNMTQKTMMPYYNYNGYTTYDGQFTQDYDFVRALKYDNVMIDGYKVNSATTDKDVASSKHVDDTMVDMNKDGQVVHISFKTKAHTVSKDMFKKAHMSNHMYNEGNTDSGSYITYKTNNGMYTAYFDDQGYLMKIMIG